MKKIIGVVLVLGIALALVACASSSPTGNKSASSSSSSSSSSSAAQERNVPGGFPDFVKKAIMNQPEDALVGIGSAKLASLSQSRTLSGTRARAEISRQLNTMIQDMVRDYQASSEVDPSAAISFQENITVALSKATLTGASVVDQDMDAAGNVWTVVMLNKTDVAKEINQAQSAAKLAVPAMASFDAEARMNQAFAKVNSEEVQVGDR